MASDTSLVFNILARDRASRVFGKVQGNLDKLSAGIGSLAVGAGAGLAKIGGDFSDAFGKIAVGTGAVGDDLEGLKRDFKEALAETPAEMGVVADAMSNLNTFTGATGETLQGLTVSVAEASRMLGEDGVANAQLFGQAMAQWQIPAEEGQDHLDALFKATQDYGVGLGEISGHLTEYGSVLDNAGFSMQESAALFGSLEASGLSVSRVMPGLNKAFRDWASEGKNVQDELASTVTEIENAESSTDALAIATDVFGAEGAQRMTSAIRSGAIELDDLSGALGGAEGLIGDTADSTDSWQEKLATLKNEGLVAVEPLASALFDKLGTGVDVLKDVVKWGEENTGVVKGLAVALGSIAATVLAVNAGLKVYRGIQMAIRAVTVAWTAVQWALNVAMSANPIGLIIVAIVALIGIIVLIATKTTWFQDLWRIVWGGIKAAALAVWQWISGTLWPGIQAVWDGIVAGVKLVWQGVKKYFGFWKGLLETVIGWVVGVWKSARDNFLKIVDFVKGLPGRIASAARGMWDGIKDAFRGAINWLIGKWNGLSFTIPEVTVPVIGTLGGFTLHTPDLPLLAEGGIVTDPTLAMLGEGGRDEAVVPLPPGFTARDLTGDRRDDVPEEFEATATIDLGEGIRQVVELQLRRRDRQLRRRVLAGAGAAR